MGDSSPPVKQIANKVISHELDKFKTLQSLYEDRLKSL